MNHKPGGNSALQIGRGSPFSRHAISALWQVIISPSPANDWAKGRVLTMVVSLVAVGWALIAVLGLVSPGMGEGLGRSGVMMEGDEIASGENASCADQSTQGGRLRSDLFKIPKPKNENVKKAPKTNPVELLGLIELQGVLGGKTPRAIIMYKRTQKTSTVSVGDDLGEFMVVEIRDRSVILKWRDELFELSL